MGSFSNNINSCCLGVTPEAVSKQHLKNIFTVVEQSLGPFPTTGVNISG